MRDRERQRERDRERRRERDRERKRERERESGKKEKRTIRQKDGKSHWRESRSKRRYSMRRGGQIPPFHKAKLLVTKVVFTTTNFFKSRPSLLIWAAWMKAEQSYRDTMHVRVALRNHGLFLFNWGPPAADIFLLSSAIQC